MALIASSTAMVCPGLSPSLVGACSEACSDTFSVAVELDLAGFETLKQQVERHDLGQRGRMAWRIRIRGLQHSATVAVNDDRGGWRRIVFGVAQIAGACKSRCNGGKAKQTVTKPSAGSPPCHRTRAPDYPEWVFP